MPTTHYKTLRLTPKATQDDIQKAYRALAAEVYPGVNRGEEAATAQMKEINRAYEVLRNPDKRSAYDETLSPAPAPKKSAPETARPTAPKTGGPTVTTGGSFFDALNSMRDAAQKNARGEAQAAQEKAAPAAGSIPVVDVWLTPREALDGTVKDVQVGSKTVRLKIRIRR